MRLNEIIRRNATFVEKGLPDPAAQGQGRLLVVAASCPEMAGLLEGALGLQPGAAVVVQLSGAWGGKEGEELLRSVALGIYVHACDEILIVGVQQAADCPPRRQQLIEALKAAGLDTNSQEARQILDLARGPNSGASGVSETVRLLRHSSLVPERVPVHGAILDVDTGLLRLTDQAAVRVEHKRALKMPVSPSSPPADFPLPELPDIPLPQLPELDLDALLQSASTAADKPTSKPTRKVSDYGKEQGGDFQVGPVSADALQRAPVNMPMGPSSMPEANPLGTSLSGISFELPAGIAIQDTGLGSYEHLMPGRPEILPAMPAKSSPKSKPDKLRLQARASRKAMPAANARLQAAPRPKIRPEQPAVTPIATLARQARAHAPAQAPMNERLLSFDEDTPAASVDSQTLVDIRGGYVSQEGIESPLDADLQRALIKVNRFLADEFSPQEREDIRNRIRRSDQQGQDVNELIKIMINPVLKLGKKRYAVINELLRIKEDLPRHTRQVVVALLDNTIKGV